MKRRRRREGTGAIVRAVREQGDRIVAAIERTAAAQNVDRRAAGELLIVGLTSLLRDALDLGRAAGLGRPVGNDTE